MNFHVLTLFPEMIEQGMHTSVIGKAIDKGLLTLDAVNIRTFAEPCRKGRVDDTPYGGGAGMVMQAEPVYRCWKSVADQIWQRRALIPAGDSKASLAGHHIRTVFLTPQGRVFDQAMAHDLAEEEDIIFLCGHYEGIDERVLEEIVTDNVSIGDYVLTGGELPAMVMMDTISRLIPGVLHNTDSAVDESFEGGLLEYPQYTRPEVWHDRAVPSILLSGDHARVDRWRRDRSIDRTIERRPDLMLTAPLDKKDRRYIESLNIDEENYHFSLQSAGPHAKMQ